MDWNVACQSFEELEVWKRACRLAIDVCESLKKEKQWFIKDQMQRAALSVPSNIAEGAERGSNKDFIRFLRIAKGSAAELRTQCYIARKLSILNKEENEKLVTETKEVSAMLQGLINSLE